MSARNADGRLCLAFVIVVVLFALTGLYAMAPSSSPCCSRTSRSTSG